MCLGFSYAPEHECDREPVGKCVPESEILAPQCLKSNWVLCGARCDESGLMRKEIGQDIKE